MDNSSQISTGEWNPKFLNSTATVGDTVVASTSCWPDYNNSISPYKYQPTVYYPYYVQPVLAGPTIETAQGGWIIHSKGKKFIFTDWDKLCSKLKELSNE